LFSLSQRKFFKYIPQVGLQGLENLTSARGLYIYDNNFLIHLEGLENLTWVGGDLLIYNNYILTSLGLDSLCIVEDDFIIKNNNLLCVTKVLELWTQVVICSSLQGHPPPTGFDNSGNREDC
jgi:hypothetical protein